MRSYVWRVVLGIWVGGLLAFGAIFAPALFRVLPREQAGAVVRQVIPVMDVYGMAAAAALLALSMGDLKERRTHVRRGLLLAMGLCSAASFFFVTPAMEGLRRDDDASRQQFGRLHGASTSLAGLVLVLGVAGLALPPKR